MMSEYELLIAIFLIQFAYFLLIIKLYWSHRPGVRKGLYRRDRSYSHIAKVKRKFIVHYPTAERDGYCYLVDFKGGRGGKDIIIMDDEFQAHYSKVTPSEGLWKKVRSIVRGVTKHVSSLMSRS